MNKVQRRTIIIATIGLIFFLVLSMVTKRWGFFLYSLLPLFLITVTAFTSKHYKTKDE